MSRAALLLLLASVAWAAPSVTATPDRVVLGRDRTVVLVARGDQVLGSASAGTLSGPVRADDGWRFVWTPPTSGSPRTAVLLFWEAAATSPDVAVVRVPMAGRTDLAVETEPDANVTVTIEGHTFGPRRADARGHVKVPVEVPPAARVAKVSAQAAGRTKDREVPLDLPPDDELALALGPQPMDSHGGWALAVGSRSTVSEQAKVTAVGARIEPSGAEDGGQGYRVAPTTDRVTVHARFASAHAQESAQVVATRPEAPSHPTALFAGARPAVEAGIGYFSGGGDNTGLAVRMGAELGPLVANRVYAELLLGFRHAGLDKTFPGLGTLHSSISGFPILIAARGVLFEQGLFGLDARAGVGLLPFRHSISSTFGADFSESKLSWTAMIGVDARLRLGAIEPFLEVQGALAPTKTDRVDANLGGIALLAGARYRL